MSTQGWSSRQLVWLNITMKHDKTQIRQYASIPDAERPLVEKTLRDFGKWKN
jgi:hypothetical protein